MNSTKKVGKVAFVLGTRPEIIKLYPVIRWFIENKEPYFIIHTNQHYDEKMDKVFFDDLGLPTPKYNLHIGSGKQADQTARMMMAIEKVLEIEKPEWVVVQGDTNTVMAGALTAAKMGIKVAHVEAGLRSYDRTMPEEINRVVTDNVADILFCPTKLQREILTREGMANNRIKVTGNTIVDAVKKVVKNISNGQEILVKYGLKKNQYFLLTCHRPANTDDELILGNILTAVDEISKKEGKICLFPVHPRLKTKVDSFKKYQNIKLCEPICYPELLYLQKNCSLVFTDSGGIQEEACILKKKCVILRLNTERPETLRVGGAVILKKMSREDIWRKFEKLKNKKVLWSNPFGDGRASSKIGEHLTSRVNKN